MLTTTPDGEGRISSLASAAGQSPVSATQYDASSNVTSVSYGSGSTPKDHDTFSFDPNTERPTGYKISVYSVAQAQTITSTATMTNNTNGTVNGLNIVDGFFSGDTQNCAFAYDDLNRLASGNCGSVWGAAYSYDAFGNINKNTIPLSPGTTFTPLFSTSTNQFTKIGSFTPQYDTNGNLTNDNFHTYGWDADGNLITVDGSTGTFDALGRRVELGSAGGYSQMLYPPFAPTYQMAGVSGLTAGSIRIPLPGGGQAIFGSTGLLQYRHPNWQGSQVLLSTPSGSPNPSFGGAFTAFGEKYAIYPGGDNGYFAGMLGVADAGAIPDAYQATARLYHQDEGRWVSPDPAGLGAVDLSNPQTMNRYAYVANNPLNFTDPSGLYGYCPWGTDNSTSPPSCSPPPPPCYDVAFGGPPIGGGCGYTSGGNQYAYSGSGSTNIGGSSAPSAPNNTVSSTPYPPNTPKTPDQCSVNNNGTASGTALYNISRAFPNNPKSNQMRGCLQSLYSPQSGYIPLPVLIPTSPGSWTDLNSLIPGTWAHLNCALETLGAP